ncbi:hypothetical protein KR044_010791, partial [Drosophila immigrans]
DAAMLRFTNVICHSGNVTSYTIHTCRLKALQRNKIGLFFNATLNYKVKQLTLHFQSVKKANGYKPWLYNYSVDCCDYLRKRNNPVFNILTNLTKEYTNMIHTCPFEGPLTINGLFVKPSSIPLPLPTGEYGILTTWKFDKNLVVIINVYFEFIEDII